MSNKANELCDLERIGIVSEKNMSYDGGNKRKGVLLQKNFKCVLFARDDKLKVVATFPAA